MVELRTVAPAVEGSNPSTHPIPILFVFCDLQMVKLSLCTRDVPSKAADVGFHSLLCGWWKR